MNDGTALKQPFINGIRNKGELFKEKIIKAKEKTKSKLYKKLEEEKLKVIREALTNAEIKFDQSINSIEELDRSLKMNLSEDDYRSAKYIIEMVTSKLDNLVDELSNGSTTALNRTLNKIDTITDNISNTIGLPLAGITAVSLTAATPFALPVLGGVLGYATYKIIKNAKSGQVLSQNYELDKILSELEITEVNGKIIDTRFGDEVLNIIREFLKSKKIYYDDTGYLSVKSAISNLPFEYKKELCEILNQRLNAGIDIDERLASRTPQIFERLKHHIEEGRKVSTDTTKKVEKINSNMPEILSGAINGALAGVLVKGLLNSTMMAAGITGLAVGVGTLFLKYIPYVGDSISNALPTENLIVGSVLGGAAGFLGSVGKSVVDKVKEFVNRRQDKKHSKEVRKVDNALHSIDDVNELVKVREKIKTNNPPEQVALFNLTYSYITEELGIKFEKEPTTLEELKKAIQELDDESKKKVHKFIGKLKDYNQGNSIDMINSMKKIGRVTSNAAILGLSAVNVSNLVALSTPYSALTYGTTIGAGATELLKDMKQSNEDERRKELDKMMNQEQKADSDTKRLFL